MDTEVTTEMLYEILVQINENVVDGCTLISALIGMIIGYLAVKELLKIWLS